MSRSKRFSPARDCLSRFVLFAVVTLLVTVAYWASTSVIRAAQPSGAEQSHWHDAATEKLTIGVAAAPADATLQCDAALPDMLWLGEGPTNYVLPEGYDTFVIKRRPFRFQLEQGVDNAAGQRIYQAAEQERVWACGGDCQVPAVFHSAYDLGTLGPGTVVNLVVIDDDGPEQGNDQRRNWWALNDPEVPYQIVEEQTMVEYLTLEIPTTGRWYYYANDSIGISATCVEPSLPTATPEPSSTPTATATATPLPTATATSTSLPTATPINTPTSTPEPSATPTATATPSHTATAAPSASATPSATPTVLATVTATPTLLATVTATSTATPEPTSTATATPTPEATPVGLSTPTALHMAYFTAESATATIRLHWATVSEMDLRGFQLWRSATGQRADAIQITPHLIRSRGVGSTGAVYRFDDRDVIYGLTYTYWLQQVATAGPPADANVTDVDVTTAQLMHAIYLPRVER